MNKAEAIEKMKAGQKLTHPHFSDNEWANVKWRKIYCGYEKRKW